jgi:hypothetical protein
MLDLWRVWFRAFVQVDSSVSAAMQLPAERTRHRVRRRSHPGAPLRSRHPVHDHISLCQAAYGI